MDAEGEEGGACLSKPTVENEASDEGGMLCILNAQTPVRGEGKEISIGFFKKRDKAKTAMQSSGAESGG